MITPKYRLGSIVYFVTDLDAKPYIVVGIVFRPNTCKYIVCYGAEGETEVYDIEISKEKTIY